MIDQPPRRRRRWIGLILLIVAVVVFFAQCWTSQVPSPALELPVPNGYDDLDRAGGLIQGPWPVGLDISDPGFQAVRDFVKANHRALETARVGLGREPLVPIENSRDGLSRHFEALGRVNSVAILLDLEASVFQSDGRFVDAARSFLDEMAVGQAMTQGGMAIDVRAGWVHQRDAIERLRHIKDRLPGESIVPMLRELETLDRRRVSPEAVERRWAAWYAGTHNLGYRVILRWNGIEKKGRTDEVTMAKQSRDRTARSFRYFLAELAIHAYHGARHTWPRSLADLVPAYLSSVPIDPSSGRPIEYPANQAGVLTDDLTAIARPDGEVAAPRP